MLVGLMHVKLTRKFREKFICKYIANFDLIISGGEVEVALPN